MQPSITVLASSTVNYQFWGHLNWLKLWFSFPVFFFSFSQILGQISGERVNYTSLFIVILNICKWSASLGKVRSPPKKSRCWVTIWQPESAALLPILESRTETSATDAKSQSRHHFLYPTVFSCVMDSPLRFWSLFIFLIFNWKCLLAVVLINFIQYYAKSSIKKKLLKQRQKQNIYIKREKICFDLRPLAKAFFRLLLYPSHCHLLDICYKNKKTTLANNLS